MSVTSVSRRKLASLASAILLSAGVSGAAHAITLTPWTISGPGSTSATQAGGVTELSYDFSPNSLDRSTKTWTAEAMTLSAGEYSFDWLYEGSHAWFGVQVFLNMHNPDKKLAEGEAASCCDAPSGFFSYSGEEALTLAKGDKIWFTFGGTNNDTTTRLTGKLKLTEPVSEVPLPAAAPLFAAALAGLGFAGRKRKS